VLTWDDLLHETKAWDALIWFAPLIMMADALLETGTIKVISDSVFAHMAGWQCHCSSGADHQLSVRPLRIRQYDRARDALYPGFLAAGLAAGAPPLLMALLLAFFSNLDAGITHYGTGSAPVYFGAGYVPQTTWWRLGFLISLLNLIIWLGIGSLWWKLLGMW